MYYMTINEYKIISGYRSYLQSYPLLDEFKVPSNLTVLISTNK